MFGFSIVMSVKCTFWFRTMGAKMPYAYPVFPPGLEGTLGARNFLIFYLILGFLLPIAIIIVLEIVKLAYTRLVEVDADLAHEDFALGDVRFASVQNSQIHEELACINYILSDKTGTITKNELVFKCLAANGKAFYGEARNLQNDPIYQLDN